MYKICFQCDDMQMASVLIQAAASNKPQIDFVCMTKIEETLSTPKRTRKHNGFTGLEFLLDCVKTVPGMTHADLMESFQREGRAPTSATTELNHALRLKQIKSNGKGGYILAK